MNDTWLLDASWIFFGVLSVIVAIITVAAFGRDLLPLSHRAEYPARGETPLAPVESCHPEMR